MIAFDIGGVMEKKVSARWSDIELEVAVNAYLDMFEMEKQSRPINKAEIGSTLREGALSGRTKSAVELRMQNISSVMVDLGQERIKGYLPAKNVGANVIAKIEKLLNDKGIFRLPGYETIPGVTSISTSSKESKIDYLAPPPLGTNHPKQSSEMVTTYARDEKVRNWILKQANGNCEACGNPAPFNGLDGEPFLEVHHVRHLAQKGSDRIENAAALCPNCHRRCHLAVDGKDFTKSLYAKINRLQEETPEIEE